MPRTNIPFPTDPKFRDLTGQIFNRLTVRELHSVKPVRWLCDCSCGGQNIVSTARLRNGKCQSCGCWEKESRHFHTLKHGRSHTRVHYIWNGMLQRCDNPNAVGYFKWGGRGITVCQRMRTFEGFIATLGERPPKMTIERIDNDGHYSCGECSECVERGWSLNVKWDTRRAQANNRRSNRLITFNGRTQTVSMWERELGMPKGVLHMRLSLKWDEHRAMTQPVRKSPKRGKRQGASETR